MRASWFLSLILLLLAGCVHAGRIGPPANSRGHATSLPSGSVFLRERERSRMFPDDAAAFEPGSTREYRNGRLVGTYADQVLVARDARNASLLYDERTRSVRPITGGAAWRFDPCRDPNGLRIIAISPNGKQGVCLSVYAESNNLVLFDVRRPDATRHVIFRRTIDSPMPVAWVDNSQIAVLELRRGQCPFYRSYGYYPTNLAIIDRAGRILRRGPCIAGILAGPRGLVYVQREQKSWLGALFGDPFDRHKGWPRFSIDKGMSWRSGSPAFADGQGNVYSFPQYASDGTLSGPSGSIVARNLFDASWAR